MSQALLLVDIQNDYVPGGAMELVGSPEAGIQAGQLLEACRRAGLAIVHFLGRHPFPSPPKVILSSPLVTTQLAQEANRLGVSLLPAGHTRRGDP